MPNREKEIHLGGGWTAWGQCHLHTADFWGPRFSVANCVTHCRVFLPDVTRRPKLHPGIAPQCKTAPRCGPLVHTNFRTMISGLRRLEKSSRPRAVTH